MSNISTDNLMGYAEFISGDDKGRYANVDVAVQAYVDELESAISDTSKEACGVRIRNDRSNATFAELEAELDSWSESAERAYNERLEDEATWDQE